LKENHPNLSVDSTDLFLLKLVQDDGQIPNAKVAEKLAMSETPCWRRRKRLEEKGLIVGYQANLNRELLGFEVLALVQICFSNHTDDLPFQFEKKIQEIPEILSCHNVTGEADYFLLVVAENLTSYEKFLRNTLRKLPGVNSIKSSLSLREVKSSSRLPINVLLNGSSE